jgi:Flp pilus assembly pilin Flp
MGREGASPSRNAHPRTRRGQSTVEYMLAISVIAIALAAGFSAFGEGVRGIFDRVRTNVSQPYP